MSEYFLFITPNATRRTEPDEQLTLAEGMCIAHIKKGRASYGLNGTEYSLTIPAEIMGQDDEIASAVRIHMDRQRERMAEANIASSSYNPPESDTVLAVDDTVTEVGVAPIVVSATPNVMEMGNNDLAQSLRSDQRRDLARHESVIRSLISAEADRVNNIIAQQNIEIRSLQADVNRLSATVRSLSRILDALIPSLQTTEALPVQ